MKVDRNKVLDFLRGIAILVMIFLHSTSYYLSNLNAFFFWNWGNFVVQIIVFVSAYLVFSKIESFAKISWSSFFIKRLTRLLIPYYIFLAVLFVMLAVFIPTRLTVSYIFQSLLVIGGIDLGWLVLLFIYLTVVTPVMFYALTRKPILFHVITMVTFLSAVILLFVRPAVHYKLTMWIPWLFMFNLAYYYFRLESKVKIKAALMLFVTGLITFIASFIVLNTYDLPIMLFKNKYPPNLFVISYGMIWIGFLYFIYNVYLIRKNYLNAVTTYFSRHSYSLYFIHSLVILALTVFNFHKIFSWPIFFIIVLGFSFIVQEVINRLTRSI